MHHANIGSAFKFTRGRIQKLLILAALLVAFVGLGGCTTKDNGGLGGGCPGGYIACAGPGGTMCYDPSISQDHCGVCGNACSAGTQCLQGVCGCPAGQISCNGACIDAANDPNNCGQCGTACSVGGQCVGGACACQGALTACGAACADTQSDGANCGACGMACTGGLLCSVGTCSATCAVGLTQCGSSCVDTQTNAANCGTCGTACPSGLACSGGACACPTAGQTSCSGVCVDTQASATNCGTCGHVCSATEVCSAGACVCAPGQNCGGGTGGASGVGGTSGVGGAGTGGAGTGGAGTGGAAAEDCTPGVDCGGYIDNGVWHGYAFTSAYGTATILPPDYSDKFAFPICANGKVPASADGSNGAMIGWSINQAATPENAPTNTVTPTKDGIMLSVKNNGTAQLRVQIQGPKGASDANDRWCAQIGTGGDNIFIPYSSFNTKCWPVPAGQEGTAYNGTSPLTQVMVTVPSAASADTNYDFCINSLAESDEGGNTGGAGCSLSAAVPGSPLSGNLNYPGNQYQRVAVNTGSKLFFVQNNVFSPNGNGAFNVSYNGASFTLTSQTQSKATNGAPIGYPSLFIGSSGGDGYPTAGSNLAKKVSALTAVPTALKWTKGSSGNYNVAYDVWFSTGSGDSGVGNRTFLMVWFGRSGNVYAEGEGEGHSGGQFTIGGKSFNTYVSQQFEGRPIISYVATSELSEYSFDLLDFIKDAKTRKSSAQAAVINDNLYLTNVFAGFEVWSGAQGMKVNNFCIDVK